MSFFYLSTIFFIYWCLSQRKPLIAVFVGKAYNFSMNKFSDIYKKPFFACAICVIYTAVSLGIALFGFWGLTHPKVRYFHNWFGGNLMDDINIALLGGFSIFIYLSTIGFFWGVFQENCSALNNSLMGKNFLDDSVGHRLQPVNPDVREFLQQHWKPIALFGLIYSGIFGFFIEHVCFYQ